MARRSHERVIADILRIAVNGAKRTHIVYNANINFQILQNLLPQLERAGLVIVGENGAVHTTEQGKNFIQLQEVQQKLLEAVA